MSFYSDDKYGVIKRQWFLLSKKFGGFSSTARAGASRGCFGTTDATSKVHITRWYPKGPIKMIKAGSFVQATMTQASSDLVQARITTRGGSASTGCSWYVKSTSTAVSAFAIASTTTFTVKQVKAGEYVSIKTGTPVTDKGTAANTATLTGTVAFFIDYYDTFDPAGKHDLTQ
jgi:hypothetical protein